MNNWIKVSEANLAHNLRVLQTAAGAETEVLAVVKANAYGHGAERCAPMLARAGARWLGVTCASEGARVRAALGGTATEILVMCGFLPEDVWMMATYRLTPVLWTAEQVRWLGQTGLRVHVEVDTGMGRQGVRPGSDLAELLDAISAAGLVVDGVFTHFCSSEVVGAELTGRQQGLFAEALEQVRRAGLRPNWVHAGNTSFVDNPVSAGPSLVALAAAVGGRAMVRSGLALYGYCLPLEGEAEAQIQRLLLPVVMWKARVLAVRELLPGETVGYNATFTAKRKMRVALLPVGYADGLRRELSWREDGTGGWVMVRGERAAILGRISMNLTVVDVSGIAGVQAGDEAVVLGPGITADDHARLAGTIAYEILCGIHPCG